MMSLHDHTPTAIKPVITMTVIVLCGLVFLGQISLDVESQKRFIYSFGFIPAVLLGERELAPVLALVPPVLTLVTTMFLHGGWMHLLGNMLYLWVFGSKVEDAMGHAHFGIFFLLCGLTAAAIQMTLHPDSIVPMVGSSSAISGVLGAYLLLYPRAHIVLKIPFGFRFRTIYLPSLVVLGLWFMFQQISSNFPNLGEAEAAWYAHASSFFAGMVLIPLFKRRNIQFFNSPHRDACR